MLRYTCPFCCQAEAYHIRFDKKDRPYWACGVCNHRQFAYNALAFFMAGELAKAVTANAEQWRTAAMEQMRTYFGDQAGAMTYSAPTRETFERAGVA